VIDVDLADELVLLGAGDPDSEMFRHAGTGRGRCHCLSLCTKSRRGSSGGAPDCKGLTARPTPATRGRIGQISPYGPLRAHAHAHAIRPIRRDVSNPSISFQRVPAGTAGRRGQAAMPSCRVGRLTPPLTVTEIRNCTPATCALRRRRETALAARGDRVAQQRAPLLAGRGFSLKCRAA
jgi:hypothetical protein